MAVEEARVATYGGYDVEINGGGGVIHAFGALLMSWYDNAMMRMGCHP